MKKSNKYPIIKIHGDITQNKFYFCKVSINGNIKKVKLVSDLSIADILKKISRTKIDVKKLDIYIEKEYYKILY